MIIQKIGVPIYLQVKAYVLDKIKTGHYKAGDKLPAERQLAEKLGISRNTVSAAYKELLLEGILDSEQGRGTFVRTQTADITAAGADIAGSRLERALKVIDSAMTQVVELGFTVEQFASITAIRAKERELATRQLRVAVVEGTQEYGERFIDQLGQVANAHFEVVTLVQLSTGAVRTEYLEACDLVVTTMDHQAAVAGILGNSPKLMAVATTPNLEAVIKLARLPIASEVAVIAKTQGFIDAVEQILAKIGCNTVTLMPYLGEDREQIRAAIVNYNAVITAWDLQNVVRQVATATQDIIIFYYEIDQGSLQQIASRLVTENDKAKE